MRLIVGVTGASGAVYGIKLLRVLKDKGIETHLVITKWGERTIKLETNMTIEDVKRLATKCYEENDLIAPIASGSYVCKCDGVIVIPCSIKTLSGIANGYASNLLLRAADVAIKEERPLILVVRENPLSSIHLQNMLRLANIGVTILPATPAFYHKPETIDDLVNHVVGKVLDILDIPHELYQRWEKSYEGQGIKRHHRQGRI